MFDETGVSLWLWCRNRSQEEGGDTGTRGEGEKYTTVGGEQRSREKGQGNVTCDNNISGLFSKYL